MRVLYSASIDIGIMSGGIDASFLGIVQGAVGFESSPQTNFLASPSAIALHGQLAVAASIYGKVDFGIVSASVNLSVAATVGFSIVTNEDIVLSVSANVEVSVRVHVHLFGFTVTIGFHFSATIHREIVIPWEGATLAGAREPVAFLARTDVRERIAAARGATLPPLTLYFTPEVTMRYPASGGRGVAQAVVGLTLERAAFAELAQAAAHWTLLSASANFREHGRVSREQLREIGLRLRANRRDPGRYGAGRRDGAGGGEHASAGEDPTAADYAKLTSYLSTAFTVTVAPVPLDGKERVMVPFPMMPEALLSVSGRENEPEETWPRDFRAYNLRDAAWREAVEAYLAALDTLGGVSRAQAAEPGSTLPVCEYLFVDYFQMLHEGAIEALDRALARSGADELHASDVASVNYEELAGNVVTTFRQGLQLPDGPAMVGLYELTGQQFELRAQAGQTYTLSLAAPADVDWYVSGDARATLDAQGVSELEAEPTPVPLRSDPTIGAFFAEQQRTYPFANPTTWKTPTDISYLLSAFPPPLASDVAAAPSGTLEVLLRQRDPAGGPQAPGEALAVGAAQALSVRIKVRRVPGASDSYALRAIDAGALDAIGLLLAAIAAGEAPALESDLLFGASGGEGSVPEADRAAVVLLRANLKTEIAPPNELLAAALDPPAPSVIASLEDVSGLLEILRSYGRTNASGYYLIAGCQGGLPSSAFSGEEAELLLLVRAPAVPPGETKPVGLSRCFDTLVLGPLPAKPAEALYSAEAAPATGLVEHAATVAPGILPVVFSCPAAEADDLLWSMYSLLTYEIDAAGGFKGSVTAVPARPALAADSEATWIYRLFAPLARFATGSPGQSPYPAIGQPAQLTFRVRDCFGNELPAEGGEGVRTVTYDYLYTDRLLAPSAWPGVQLSYDFLAASERTVLIVLEASGPTLDSLRKTGAPAACAHLRSAIDQLGGPAVQLSVATNLDPSARAYTVGSANAPYAPGSPTVATLLESVLAYLEASQPGVLPPPCTIELRPPATLTTQTPFELAVRLTVTRTQSVDETLARVVPEVASVTGAASAIPTKPAAELARDFAAAWAGYILALAAGADGSGEGIYALSEKLLEAEVLVGATQPPLYFSPAPIANELASGSIVVPAFNPGAEPPLGPPTATSYTDTDLDESMAALFATLDTVLSPGAAATGAAHAPSVLVALVRARAALAQQYAMHQLTWLFAEQTPLKPSPEDEANRDIAVSVFSAQLDSSLRCAYEIQSLLQCAVRWKAPDAGSGVSETLELFGTVAPAGGEGDIEASTAKVRLPPGGAGAEGRLTFTSTVDAPALDASRLPFIDCKLVYTVTHIALEASDSTTAPAIWLRLLEPRTLTLGQESLEIPAPRRQFPVPPTLVSQAWEAATLASPPTLEELRGWSYVYDCAYLSVPQDSLATTVSYAQPQASLRGGAAGEQETALSLADSLALFRQGYARIAAVLATLGEAPPSPDCGPALAYLEYLVERVLTNSDWNHALEADRDEPPPDAYELAIAFLDATPEGCEAQGRLVLRLSSTSAAAVAAATVTPCDASGQPLPESQLHRCPYKPGELAKVVVYDLDPYPAWPQFEVRIDGLDVIARQSAWASVQTVRNADLLPNLTTNPGFVYRSAAIRATRRTTPSLEYQNLVVSIPTITGHATGTIAEYMESLLLDLLTAPPQSATPLPPSYTLRMGANLKLVLAWTQEQEALDAPPAAIATRSPIALSTTIEIAPPSMAPAPGAASPGELATELAEKLLAYLAQAPYAPTATLVISITLFATDPENPGAVLTLGQLELPIANLRDVGAEVGVG